MSRGVVDRGRVFRRRTSDDRKGVKGKIGGAGLDWSLKIERQEFFWGGDEKWCAVEGQLEIGGVEVPNV